MLKKQTNLTGKRFERLVVLSLHHRDKNHKAYYLCECDCGNEVIIRGSHLTDGSTKSCGCYRTDTCYKMIMLNTTHMLSHTKLYRVWRSMIHRCYNPKCRAFKDYGSRNIKICDEWKNDFVVFYNWAMKNGYEDNMTIDRINVNGNYEPSNCRWVNMLIQGNNRRNNHYITYNGTTHTLTEWSRILGINDTTLFSRICGCKWSIERAFTTPVRKKKDGRVGNENNNK